VKNAVEGGQMKIYAKVGTGPGQIIQVGFKHKLPKIGDFIKFKTYPYEKYARWQRGVIDEIRDVGQMLYLIARM